MIRCGSHRRFGRTAIAGLAFAAATAAAGSAQAGGFINQSQSSVFNGTAYAGYAAPGSSSIATMFLNPATMTTVNRLTIDTNYSLVIGDTRIRGTGGVAPAPGVFVPAFGAGSSGDVAQDSLVPASYVVFPFSDRLFFGLSINAPYGSVTKPNIPWVGQLNSLTTKARTITITPQVAYKVSDNFSIGFGLQIQRFSALFLSASQPFPTVPPAVVGFKGDGWSFGVTAGVTFTPWAGTQFGLGYRSRIDQDLEGNYLVTGSLINGVPVRGTLKLPDRVNLSVRQTITPELDLLASAEWQGWGRIGTAALIPGGPLAPFVPAALRFAPFEYKNGWYFALGGEYKYSPKLTLRGGVAYEISPVSTRVRATRLPDNDRIWTSIGMTYHLSDRFSINASYSHVFMKNSNIALTWGNPSFNPATTAAFFGSGKTHVDIISIGLTSRWGSKAPAVVAKY